MVDFKHNITGMLDTSDSPVWGLISGVNVASDYVLAWTIVLVIYVVSAYFIMRKTSDIGKGFVQSSLITTILTMILYYGGKLAGVDFIPDILFLGLIVITAISGGGIYFSRLNKNESQ